MEPILTIENPDQIYIQCRKIWLCWSLILILLVMDKEPASLTNSSIGKYYINPPLFFEDLFEGCGLAFP